MMQESQCVCLAQCSNMKMKICLLFFGFVSLVGAMDEKLFEDGMYRDALVFLKECGARKITLCLKEKALKFLERLPNNFDIGSGIVIKQSETERASREVDLPEESKEREEVLDRVLLERIFDYLTSHTLEVKIPTLLKSFTEEEEEIEQARKRQSYGGSSSGKRKRRKGGKKGGMSMMLMMFLMKSAALYAIGMKAIAALAFKALLIGKVALTISMIIAMKKLLSQKQSSTYEVITHHDDHLDRVYNPADLVYRGHRHGS